MIEYGIAGYSNMYGERENNDVLLFFYYPIDIYKKKLYFIMNDRQQRLYDYLMRYKIGAFNSIANSRWTDNMRSLNMEDEVRQAGRYIDDVAGEGIREMWRKGIDSDVAGLSRKEIREVAEAVYLFALKNKQSRMGDRRSVEDIMKTYRAESRINIDKIITEAINKICNTSI